MSYKSRVIQVKEQLHAKMLRLSMASGFLPTSIPGPPFHCQVLLAFLVACGKAAAGHVFVWVEDDRHDMPGGGEGWRGHLATESPQQVALVSWGSIVDLQEVKGTSVVVLQVKGVEGELHRGALSHHNQPATLCVVGVEPGEVGAGEVSRRCWEHTSTFDTWDKREWLRVSAGILGGEPSYKARPLGWEGLSMVLNQPIYSCICSVIHLCFKYLSGIQQILFEC